LSGYLAGLSLAKEGSNTICYIKSYNDTVNTLRLNSFAYGAMKANRKAKIRYWTSNTEVKQYVLNQLTNKMLQTGFCEQLAATQFNVALFRPFTIANKFVSVMNVDAQPLMGSNVLSSAIVDWSKAYDAVIRMEFNDVLKLPQNTYITVDYNDEAVLISPLSPYVPPEHVAALQGQITSMTTIGAQHVVLCGPVKDSFNNTRIDEGTCPTYKQLYTMVWAINNTVISTLESDLLYYSTM